MTKFRESQTAKNLMLSFAGESQARNRYTYFSRKAAEDGYIQISDIFEETASQECEHALRFFKFFNGGEMEITGSFPSGVIKTTYENLVAAADGEKFEHSELYPGFANIAREEGFERAADTWDAISVSERQHEKRYRELAGNLAADRVFKRAEERTWRCMNCGYIHVGEEAPDKCPACVHPREFFELLCENW
jgi:rubrerythrin